MKEVHTKADQIEVDGHSFVGRASPARQDMQDARVFCREL